MTDHGRRQGAHAHLGRHHVRLPLPPRGELLVDLAVDRCVPVDHPSRHALVPLPRGIADDEAPRADAQGGGRDGVVVAAVHDRDARALARDRRDARWRHVPWHEDVRPETQPARHTRHGPPVVSVRRRDQGEGGVRPELNREIGEAVPRPERAGALLQRPVRRPGRAEDLVRGHSQSA